MLCRPSVRPSVLANTSCSAFQRDFPVAISACSIWRLAYFFRMLLRMGAGPSNAWIFPGLVRSGMRQFGCFKLSSGLHELQELLLGGWGVHNIPTFCVSALEDNDWRPCSGVVQSSKAAPEGSLESSTEKARSLSLPWLYRGNCNVWPVSEDPTLQPCTRSSRNKGHDPLLRRSLPKQLSWPTLPSVQSAWRMHRCSTAGLT